MSVRMKIDKNITPDFVIVVIMLLLFWLEFFLQACLFLLVQRKYLKIFFLFLSKDDFNFLDSSTLPASLTEICPSLCPSLCLHYSFFYFLLFPFPIFRLSVPFTPSIVFGDKRKESHPKINRSPPGPNQ